MRHRNAASALRLPQMAAGSGEGRYRFKEVNTFLVRDKDESCIS